VRLGVPIHIVRERHSRIKNKNRMPVTKREEEVKHGFQPRALALRFEMVEYPPAPSFTAEMNPEEMAKKIDDEMLRSVLDAQRCNLKRARRCSTQDLFVFSPSAGSSSQENGFCSRRSQQTFFAAIT